MRGTQMEPIKIESKQTLSREDAAAFLSELGSQLAKGDHVELDRQGVHYSFGVPDEVELELDDSGTELEIELHW